VSEAVSGAEGPADRERYFSGGIWESAYGYARAMRVGRFVLVSGCTSMVEGRVRFPADPGAQLRVAIQTALTALSEFGAAAEDVVRTRMYVTHRRDCDAVGGVHAEVFGAQPPVATMVIVSGLLHPDMRVEIEVEAVLPYSADADRAG
jgi:enamine deaminase RidA (YjgF/YER057c/UK114 family)